MPGLARCVNRCGPTLIGAATYRDLREKKAISSRALISKLEKCCTNYPCQIIYMSVISCAKLGSPRSQKKPSVMGTLVGIQSHSWWKRMVVPPVYGTNYRFWPMPISAITHLQTIIYNVLLVKIKGPVWYTIYHQTNRLFKGFVQARLLINQPIGKGHLCHMISAMISTKKNKHISNHIYFICGVLSLTIILSESYTYQPDEVCPFSIDIPPYKYIYIYIHHIL